MNNTYIDFHTHTTNSDGAYTPVQLCRMARQAGIGVLAITDHNYTEDLTALRAAFRDIYLIQGSEISCIYTDDLGKETELHVVALGFDPANPKLRAVLDRNQPDRQPYIDAILDRLRQCGIDLGTYDDLCKQLGGKRHIGRMDIAKLLMERGDVASIEEAFDEYVGGHGKRRAYVPNKLRYVSLEEAVEAILDAGGVAVLAHLYYFLLNDEENDALLRRFKKLTGKKGAMEVYYSLYDQQQRRSLLALAQEHDLMPSAASDFHGYSDSDTVAHHFESSDCAKLLDLLVIGERSSECFTS